jgi:hypothetical protein
MLSACTVVRELACLDSGIGMQAREESIIDCVEGFARWTCLEAFAAAAFRVAVCRHRRR